MSKSIEVISRGLLVRAGHILVCQNDAAGYFYLPGGHVEVGERSVDALRRELMEEAGIDVEVGALALVGEGRFFAHSKLHHELNLVFHVKHDLTDLVESKESGISFHWVDVTSLADTDLRPAAVKAWLMAGAKGLEWVSDFPPKPPEFPADTRT